MVSTLACTAVLAIVAAASPAPPPQAPFTVQELRELPTTNNEPGGDRYLGTPEQRGSLVDRFLADASLAGSAHLFLAARTAMELGREVDAGVLLYAGQLRLALEDRLFPSQGQSDWRRYAEAQDGATTRVVQAALLKPDRPVLPARPRLVNTRFGAAIRRLDSWPTVPAPGAGAPGRPPDGEAALPRAEWPAAARALKDDFMERFGKRYARLFAEPGYLEAWFDSQRYWRDIQDPMCDGNESARLKRQDARIRRLELRLFGSLEREGKGPGLEPWQPR